jgi:ubiquinone/menaquinone biosynthesis C-methylase UbiE
MDHSNHVNLLRPAKLSPGGEWADFGAGSGAFTLALRELIGNDAMIHAVDKDRAALNELEYAHRARFGPNSNLIPLAGDFSKPLQLPPLDGIVMANSLHYFRNKRKTLEHVRSFLKPNGLLLVVEYNVDRGNPWVPYPFSFETFCEMVKDTEFQQPRLLAKAPSSFLREFYSAVCFNSI